MTRLAAPVIVLVSSLLVSCVEPEPSYSVNHVVFDADLVGTWRYEETSTDEAGNTTTNRFDLVLAPRTLAVKEGRVQPQVIGGEQRTTDQPAAPNAYDGTLRIDEEGKTVEVELKGFLVAIDEWRFLAFQPSSRQLDAGHLSLLALPAHQAVRVQPTGDQLTISFPATRLAWLPDVQWLDAPAAPATEPVLPPPPAGDDEAGPLIITNDIDRFIAAMRNSALHDGFWRDPVVLKRVAR
ncbi:MAG: hypothetical protein AMXMBFR58_02460 [Phycisphaerae bacterium]